jgi:hypothetical protein
LQISTNAHQNHSKTYSNNIGQEKEEIQSRVKQIERNPVERGRDPLTEDRREDPLTKDKSKGPE